MIIWTVIVSLALVYVGGSFFNVNDTISLGLAAIGAGWLGIVFATQQRLLTNATRRNQQ